MKRIICFILSALMLCTMCACGAPHKADDSGKLKIITTIFPPYDFVRQIAGDRVELTMLLPPDTESHGFEPTLAELAMISQCDLFILAGDDSEAWAENIINNTEDGPICVKLTDMVELVCSDHDHNHEHHGHEHKHDYDTHVWTSPKCAASIVEHLCQTLCGLDPDNTDFYRKNTESYLTQLDALDKKFADIVSQGKRRTVVFAERFPFTYLAEEYGLDYHASFFGCSSETEPSLSVISQLIEIIDREDIPVIFYIEFSTQIVADLICEATGAQKLLFHSCHNVTREEFENGATYLQLMEQNSENLRKALN